MAEVLNLRLARKRKAREQSEKQAAENRASFGRSRARRNADEAMEALDRRRHEGHRRDNGGGVGS